MIKLRCVIERITYQNQENGYSIMKVRVKDYKDDVTLVGNLLDVPVGAVLLCEGNWKMDKRYGNQFVAETWEKVMPATVYGIEKYLGSGLVKGMGPKFAHLIVEKVSLEDRTLTINFDDTMVEYEASELDEVVLAYATTIHKSQGSEYPIVVIPVLMTHFVMLQRNLIYTGITRAKKICILIGQTKALSYAIRNLTVSKRNTLLKERLRGETVERSKVIPMHESKPYEIPEVSGYSMAAEPDVEYEQK